MSKWYVLRVTESGIRSTEVNDEEHGLLVVEGAATESQIFCLADVIKIDRPHLRYSIAVMGLFSRDLYFIGEGEHLSDLITDLTKLIEETEAEQNRIALSN